MGRKWSRHPKASEGRLALRNCSSKTHLVAPQEQEGAEVGIEEVSRKAPKSGRNAKSMGYPRD